MLPKQLRYGSKVESAAAKSSRVNIAPQNGTNNYNLGDTIIFNIPTRQNLVLVPNESYLKFSLNQFTNAGADPSVYRWDSCGAHGVIQRIRIFHGSNLLQDIDNYNLLTKMLYDIQVPTDASQGKLNILAGTRSDLVYKTPVLDAAANVGAVVAALANTSISAIQVNSGDILRNANNTSSVVLGTGGGAGNMTTGTGNTNTYCLNLNCLLGTLCAQNYLPLFAATSAPIRMEITLVSDLFKALNCTFAPTLGASGLLSNVEYIANFIELGDAAMSTVVSSLQGQPLQFVTTDYRNYQYSFPIAAAGTSTQVSFAIPAKFSSLKSLFVTCRDKGSGAITFFPFSSVNVNMADYQFRIGSSIFPPKPVNTIPEMFSEVVKAIGSMSDLNYQPSIEKSSYSTVTSSALATADEKYGASAVNSGSFYIGIDLENYVNANKDSIFAGWNSNTDDIFAIMNFNGAGAVVNARFDAFAMYDSCIVFENGTAYCRY